ncbi:MAG: hypothetical protein KDD53_07920 [Bdellovibrionales bacterium]|nr:hypothetical protein [Bdellovibrionales bacterium]
MKQETFLNYANFRWLLITGFLLIAMTIVYALHRPVGGANGGTVLGYTYGVVAALAIFYLTWFGIRKRSYYASKVSLKAHLSAHVWIGIGLLLLVPLHSGFSFGLNVHTLAYALMALTIVSGIWGAVNYTTMAAEIRSNRGGGSLKLLVEQIEELSADIERSLKGASDSLLQFANALDINFTPSVWQAIRSKNYSPIRKAQAAELLESLSDSDRKSALKLLSLLDRKIDLANLVLEETRVMFWLRVWLFVHVPLSIGCLVTLLIHIVSVFYYW